MSKLEAKNFYCKNTYRKKITKKLTRSNLKILQQ